VFQETRGRKEDTEDSNVFIPNFYGLIGFQDIEKEGA
jgi:hypothetical protein